MSTTALVLPIQKEDRATTIGKDALIWQFSFVSDAMIRVGWPIH